MTSKRALWFAVVIGPLAWLLYLEIAYALVATACASQRAAVLNAIAGAAVLLASTGAVVGRRALTTEAVHRARFMATLGIGMSLLFALVIAAGAIPTVVLSPCD